MKSDNDIVAFLLDGRFIVRHFDNTHTDVRIITRKHMKFMAAMDLGPRWQKFADGPVVAVVEPEGKAKAA